MDNNRYEKRPKEDKRYVNWMLKKGHDSRRNTQKKETHLGLGAPPMNKAIVGI